MRQLLPFIGCFLGLLAQTAAQDLNNLKFTAFTTKDGLKSNFTLKLGYDRQGFLWIGQSGYLSRFDGLQYETFQNEENDPYSVPSSGDYSFALDQKGRFWVGGNDGLSYFDEKRHRFQPIAPIGGKDTLREVSSIAFDGKRTLWAHGASGLKKIDTETLHADSVNYKQPYVVDMYIDSKGRIWMSVLPAKVCLYDPVADTSHCWKLEQDIMRFKEDSYGQMWLSGNRSLIGFDPATGRAETFLPPASMRAKNTLFAPLKMIFCPEWTGNDLLWMGSVGDGVALFNVRERRFERIISPRTTGDFGRSVDHVLDLFWDPKGILWLATMGGGIRKLDALDQQLIPFQFSFSGELQGVEVSKILPAHSNDHLWWVATAGKGFLAYDYVAKSVLKWYEKPAPMHESGPENTFYDLYEDQTGALWMGGKAQFAVMRQGRISRIPLLIKGQKPTIQQILPAKDGQHLWLLSELGPCRFDMERQQSQFFPISITSSLKMTSLYRAMYEAPDGNIWLATIKGLYRLDPATGAEKKFIYLPNDPKAYFSNWINRLAATSDRKLLLATLGGALRFNMASETFEDISQNLKNQPSRLFDIEADGDSSAWAFSPDGMYQYLAREKKWILRENPPGITAVDCRGEHHLVHRVGDRLFVVKEGYGLSFNPSEMDVNRSSNTPIIAHFYIKNQAFPFSADSVATSPIVLRYDQNFLTFNFTAINYTHSDQLRFRYILEGFVGNWIETDRNRTANYTNLPPNTYTFKVLVANSAGVWNEQPGIFKFIINPPWWATWWFRLFALAALAYTVYAFFQNRIEKVRKQAEIREREAGYKQREAELKQEVAEFSKQVAEVELAALRAQMNPHFVFNCLNSINTFILLNDPKNASGYLNKFSKLIRRVLDASRSESISLRDELDTLRYYIELEQMRYGGRFQYQINTPESLDLGAVDLPPMLIQPYVENAIWHGLMNRDGEGGLLSITVHQQDRGCRIIIEDNGVGRKKAAALKSRSAVVHKSHGMAVTDERIKIINELYGTEATVTVEDLYDEKGVGKGTRVILDLPSTER